MHSDFVKFVRQFSVLTALLTAILSTAFLAIAWTGPTGTPPNNNASPAIHVGATTQIKEGSLGVVDLVADRLCLGADCLDAWPPNFFPENYIGVITYEYPTVVFRGREGKTSYAYPSLQYVNGGWLSRMRLTPGDSSSTCDSGWKSGFSATCSSTQSNAWFSSPPAGSVFPIAKGRGSHNSSQWCGQEVFEYPDISFSSGSCPAGF